MSAPRWILGSGLLVLAGSSGDERIEHAPKEGTVLTQVFESTLELVLEDFDFAIDEQPFPHWGMNLEYEERRRTAFIDRYCAMSPERPLELRRTFEELRNEEDLSRDNTREPRCDSVSRLEGETVVFSWLDAQQIYRADVRSGAWIDPARVDALSPDTYLAGFLPPSEVSPGDRWLVDARCLEGLYGPGGTTGAVECTLRETLDFAALLAALDSDLEVRFVRTELQDGIELAVLDLSRRVEAKTHSAEDKALFKLGYVRPEDASECTTELILDVEGRLLWDLRAGHAHSLSLEAGLQLERRLELRVEAPTWATTFSSREHWSGRFSVELEVTRDCPKPPQRRGSCAL